MRRLTVSEWLLELGNKYLAPGGGEGNPYIEVTEEIGAPFRWYWRKDWLRNTDMHLLGWNIAFPPALSFKNSALDVVILDVFIPAMLRFHENTHLF
jgi:hypothetical protein